MQKVLITGGAGFIGSAVIRLLIRDTDVQLLNYDKLTYAGNLASLGEAADSPRYSFVQGDVADRALFADTLARFAPDVIMHLAAESHVDRSIDAPADFVHSNIVGTYSVLEAALHYFDQLPPARKGAFRLHHISTDEVYGSLDPGELFTETTAYDPSSPYSASKAASDHLVRAWSRTYGLPVLVTNCSNNYGPCQFPEKLIPLMILNALAGKALPVYGDGQQVRDWLYVEDHAQALWRVVCDGTPGETYNIGGHNALANIDVVHALCDTLDQLRPREDGHSYRQQIEFVQDRPGHDRRYAIDAGKVQRELNWQPAETFETGLARTVRWYLDNEAWWRAILDGSYHGQRLGLERRPAASPA